MNPGSNFSAQVIRCAVRVVNGLIASQVGVGLMNPTPPSPGGIVNSIADESFFPP